MRAPSRFLRLLLCAALLGVLLVIGLVVAGTLGAVAASVYAVLALVLVVVAVARGRKALAPTPLPPGRSCTCCTTSQHDPVKIV